MAWFNLKDSYTTVQRGQIIETPAGFSAIGAGPVKRLFSVTKGTFDPGGSANYIPGSGIAPIAIAIGTAKGKLEIECSNAFELCDARIACGGIGSVIIATINFIRVGMVPQSFLFLPAVWENGGGFDGDDANGFKDKLMVKFTGAFQNGASVYNELA